MLGHLHHHHGSYDDEDHGRLEPDAAGRMAGVRRGVRFGLAFVIVAIAVAAACLSIVEPGEALVVTAFGRPVRVVSEPGLELRWPAPIEAAVPVDLRLRTTSTGLHDVGTRDGLRVLVQAYVEWRVAADPLHVTQYLRSVRNDPDEAAEQLRSYLGASLEIAAAGFDLSELVNTDPARVQLGALEAALKTRIAGQVLGIYGIGVVQVGIERLTLPSDTLEATVVRMIAERDTVAARRRAEGVTAAAKIRADADRDARVLLADAKVAAAGVEATSRLDAAGIYGAAYQADPALYTLLRSLDTLQDIVGDNTRLILRTDSAPFRALVEGPGEVAGKPGGR